MASNQQNQRDHAVAAPCGTGIFGWLQSLFGSSTPIYRGTGQPVSRCGWSFFGGTPVYRAAPTKVPEPSTASGGACEPEQGEPATTEVLRPVAIIVRREPSGSADGSGVDVATE